ncbi:uncharacterized protein TNCV_3150051 [Trichonephila clavipes]|nr:uncharacterized protein TNCV_3150051 [Trichonephila clavipes]
MMSNELWFQQDGATCHTARTTIDLLKDTFGDRLISRFGPVNWPPRSCDLTPLDYILWGYVNADKPQTLDHLEDNIRRVIADIRPQMLEKVIENWTSRLDYIRASRGSPMPEIIFKIFCFCGRQRTVSPQDLCSSGASKSEDICRINWSACFPDLNLIEHMWDGLRRQKDCILPRTPNCWNRMSLKSGNSYLKELLINLDFETRELWVRTLATYPQDKRDHLYPEAVTSLFRYRYSSIMYAYNLFWGYCALWKYSNMEISVDSRSEGKN